MSENPLVSRLRELRDTDSAMRLYGCIDGLAWQDEHGARLQRAAFNRALFATTPDEPLEHAGPWLIDTHQAPQDVLAKLVVIESSRPSLIWLYSAHALDGLADILRTRLDAQLPDGRRMLLRFYDPRVMLNLQSILSATQRAELLTGIGEVALLDAAARRVHLRGNPMGGLDAHVHA